MYDLPFFSSANFGRWQHMCSYLAVFCVKVAGRLLFIEALMPYLYGSACSHFIPDVLIDELSLVSLLLQRFITINIFFIWMIMTFKITNFLMPLYCSQTRSSLAFLFFLFQTNSAILHNLLNLPTTTSTTVAVVPQNTRL